MATRSRDIDGFAYGDPRDAWLVDDGDGLAFTLNGVVPERRAVVPATYGALTLRNGVPIAYLQVDLAGRSAALSYHAFATFRGGEAAYATARMLAMLHHVLGATVLHARPVPARQGQRRRHRVGRVVVLLQARVPAAGRGREARHARRARAPAREPPPPFEPGDAQKARRGTSRVRRRPASPGAAAAHGANRVARRRFPRRAQQPRGRIARSNAAHRRAFARRLDARRAASVAALEPADPDPTRRLALERGEPARAASDRAREGRRQRDRLPRPASTPIRCSARCCSASAERPLGRELSLCDRELAHADTRFIENDDRTTPQSVLHRRQVRQDQSKLARGITLDATPEQDDGGFAATAECEQGTEVRVGRYDGPLFPCRAVEICSSSAACSP